MHNNVEIKNKTELFYAEAFTFWGRWIDYCYRAVLADGVA